MVSFAGLIPTEVLTVCRNEAAVQFDTTVDLYSMSAPDVNTDRQPVGNVQIIPARIVEETQEIYTPDQQVKVSTRTTYLPYTTTVGMHDKLVPHGQDVSRRWPPIIDVCYIPTPEYPIMLRVRQGRV